MFLKYPGLSIGPVKNGHVAVPYMKTVLIFQYQISDAFPFLSISHRFNQLDLVPFKLFSPNFFLDLPALVHVFVNTVTLVRATAEGVCFGPAWSIPEAVLARRAGSAKPRRCLIPLGPSGFGAGPSWWEGTYRCGYARFPANCPQHPNPPRPTSSYFRIRALRDAQ